MKIGIVVDGRGEYHFLKPHILLKCVPRHEYIVLKCNFDPNSEISIIVKALRAPINVLSSEDVEKIIILIDREHHVECSPELAREIEREVIRVYHPPCVVNAVLKDRKFENWLVADPFAIEKCSGKFSLSAATRRYIASNNADLADAISILNECRKPPYSYDKTSDARDILRVADPLRMAQNSRSFRRFLRLIGERHYLTQSKLPCKI